MALADPRKWQANDRVTWHGVTMDRKSAVMLDRVQKRVSFQILPSQGSYSHATTSAGTHSGSGAVDIVLTWKTGAEKRELLRALKVEFGAAWIRPYRAGVWPQHIHAAAFGSPEPDDLLALQIKGYKAGRDGLGSWPFGADLTPWRPDTAPSLNFRAWKQRQIWRWRISKVTDEISKTRARLKRLVAKRDQIKKDGP